MNYNRLGNTGLFVSELAFGTMTFGGDANFAAVGQVQQAEADRLLARALEAGINLIDTADTYSGGLSERITGQALRNIGARREEVVLATKVFGNMGPGPNQKGASRAHILDAAHASLERLGLSHIDLYQLHGFDPATPIEESLTALNDLVRQGLVRYVGVSNWAAWQVSRALGVSALHGLTRFASVQAYYTLAARDAERELLPMGRAEGLGLLAWSPLAGGLLSGKYSRAQAGEEGSRRAALDFPPVHLERAHTVIDVLQDLARARGATVAQLALAWVLHQPGVSSVLIGTKKLAQLEDNLGAVNLQLSADDLRRLNEASALPPEYPGWMLDFWSGERAQQLAEARA